MSIPPAWHPDPTGRHDHRWWDGEQWTEHVADAGVAAVDPLDGGATQPQDAGGAADGGWEAPGGEATGQGTAAGTAATGSAAGWPSQGHGAGGWPAAGAATSPAPTGSDGLAITAMILGILAVVFSWIPFLGILAAIGGIVAIVLGGVAMGRVKKSGRPGRGMAVTGLVTGIVSVLFATLVTIGMFTFFRDIGGWGPFQDYAECMEETGDQQMCDEQLEEELNDRFFGG